MRVAKECLPYESPKLSVIASVDDRDGTFAQRLKRAIQRSGKRMIGAQLPTPNSGSWLGILAASLLCPSYGGQQVPLSSDALEEFSFPIVLGFSRQSLCLICSASAFTGSYR
jgi:hypothetical protein